MMKNILAAMSGSGCEYRPSLCYTIVRSTVDGLDTLYAYANKHKVIKQALIIVCGGWVDVILDSDFVIVGAFSNDSGEGSKGYASLVNTLFDLDCEIREVRCSSALYSRLRAASLTSDDLEYMSGPSVEISDDWRRLIGTIRLHTWKPSHLLNHFRLHPDLKDIVVGHEDLSEIIFKAYRHLEALSRQRSGEPRANLAVWYTGKSGQATGGSLSDHLLRAVVSYRNERGHSPEATPPSPLELLLLDHAFRLHDKVELNKPL